MANTGLRKAIVGCLCILAMTFTALARDARAEIIEDISVRTEANGDVDAVIRFTVPVRYIRHFPHGKSWFVAIYFDILQSVPRDEWQNYESTRSPPSDIISSIAISTRDVSTGPKIEVQFKAIAETDVSQGRDGRSIVMHIRPEKKEQKPASKAVPALPPPAAPVVAAPSAPAAAVATPAVAAAASAAPAGAPPPAQSIPVASAPIPGAKLLPAAMLGPGLPLYPALEIPPTPPPPANSAAVARLPLAARIRIANEQAAVLMLKARNAIVAGKMFEAVAAFNSVLNLPTNRYTEDAQLWIGIAREQAGQAPRAKLEFETYLKLYPNGAAAPWVRERLALLNRVLPPTPVVAPAVQAKVLQAAPPSFQPTPYEFSEYGSLSMYYYTGSSHTDTLTTVGTVQSPTSLTVTDQSSLITNVSATARMSNNEFDNRLVFQDFYARDFLYLQQNRNRLNTLFMEVKNRPDNYYLRIGRQSALGGGVLGRFDGVAAGYGLTPDYRVNVVGGRLSDTSFGAAVPPGMSLSWYESAPVFAGRVWISACATPSAALSM